MSRLETLRLRSRTVEERLVRRAPDGQSEPAYKSEYVEAPRLKTLSIELTRPMATRRKRQSQNYIIVRPEWTECNCRRKAPSLLVATLHAAYLAGSFPLATKISILR